MKVIVIGANSAGMSFASKYKREVEEAEVKVYEKTDEISYGACGLPYYIGGFFDDVEKVGAKTKEDFEKEGIEMVLNCEITGVDFDEKKVFFDGGEDSYDKLIIATGAGPIVPDIEGADLEGVFTLRRPSDAVKIKEEAEKVDSVTIVGGGYIGLELAEAFVEEDKKVRLIQRDDRLLPIMDKEITDILEEYLSDYIQIELENDVTELQGDGRVEKVITDKGEFDTDLVIMSIGVAPNTKIFQGLDMLDDGSIIVNEKLETSAKDVYAIGDCATKIMKNTGEKVNIQLGTYSNRQGKLLAENFSGKDFDFPEILGTSMIKVIDLELASTGLTEGKAKEYFDAGSVFIEKDLFAAYYPKKSKAYCKLIYDKDSKVILGAQLIGKEATAQRINTFALAIQNEMTAHELEYSDIGYQPAFSTVWDIFQVASSQVD